MQQQAGSERAGERGKRDPRDGGGGGWSALTLFPSFSHPLAANHLHGFRQLIFTYLVGAEVSKSDCGAQEDSFEILPWVPTRQSVRAMARQPSLILPVLLRLLRMWNRRIHLHRRLRRAAA